MPPYRTPDARFDDLPDWPYAPAYLEAMPGLRMAYVDTGPGSRQHTYLCLHGQPTWGYLYRHMIPEFAATGGRVVVPDLYGFGRSDKPAEDADYKFHFHRNSLLRFVEQLDLQHITLVVQDWGGILGLTLPMEFAGRFDRILVMNTTLATGTAPGQGFLDWLAYSNANPDLPVAKLMARAVPHLSEQEAAAYDAPFPDARYKAGVRQFPRLVMISPDMEGVDVSRRAADWWRTQWRGQSFMAIGAADPVLGPEVMEALAGTIRGCPRPMILPQAGHFVQEWGREVARAALAHWQTGEPT